MKSLETMKLENKIDALNAKLIYVAGLVKQVRYEIDICMNDEKIEELKDYVSDISDFIINDKT